MTLIKVYTDGSSVYKKSIRYGGIGVYFENTKEEISKYYKGENCTNQRMELLACLIAINKYIESYNNDDNKLCIITDSMYAINCICEWAPKWEKNNWMRKVQNKNKSVLHLDIIKDLYQKYIDYNIQFEHIKSHRKKPADTNSDEWTKWYGNHVADKLAKKLMS